MFKRWTRCLFGVALYNGPINQLVDGHRTYLVDPGDVILAQLAELLILLDGFPLGDLIQTRLTFEPELET